MKCHVLIMVALLCVTVPALAVSCRADESRQEQDNANSQRITQLLASLNDQNAAIRLYACDDLVMEAISDPAVFIEATETNQEEFGKLLGYIDTMLTCGIDIGLVVNASNWNSIVEQLTLVSDYSQLSSHPIFKLFSRFRDARVLGDCDSATLKAMPSRRIDYILAALKNSDGSRTWDFAPKLLALLEATPDEFLQYFAKHRNSLGLVASLIAGLESGVNTSIDSSILEAKKQKVIKSLSAKRSETESKEVAEYLLNALLVVCDRIDR